MSNHIDEYITVRVPPALNAEARFLGFPVAEFFMMVLFIVVAANLSLIFSTVVAGGVVLLGKVRGGKPGNWFTFLPYLWLKIRYSYLLPAGRRTFLP